MKPWSAWEYRVLRENLSVEKTARLLARSPAEVQAVVRRQVETSLRAWYGRRHTACPGAPAEPRPLLRLARRICRQDYPRLADAVGIELLVLQVLDYTLRHFRAEAGDPTVPVARRFRQAFLCWLRQKFRRAERRRRRRERKQPRARGLLADVAQPVDVDDDFEFWAWQLFREAECRLEPRARAVIALRLEGEPAHAIASHLGVSMKTMANRYSRRRITELVRAAVRGVVLGLPPAQFQGLVAHLADVGLHEGEVARLFCLEADVLRDRLALLGRRAGPVPERDEAVAWVRGQAA